MILSNQIRCHKCGDSPYSAHRHDMKYCECGMVAVDGGTDYQRIVANGGYDNLVIEMPDSDFTELKKLLVEPLADHDIEACLDAYMDYIVYPEAMREILRPAVKW